jgi:polyhydroxyalkanoate synthase
MRTRTAARTAAVRSVAPATPTAADPASRPLTARRAATPPSELVADLDDASFDVYNRLSHAALAQLTLGISPFALALAVADWAIHLAASPGKQAALRLKALRKLVRWGLQTTRQLGTNDLVTPSIEPLPGDRRFTDPAWQQWPFSMWYQGFLFAQQWWHVATTDVPGVTKRNANLVNFMVRQWLDTWAPSNFIATNPVVLGRTVAEAGSNLAQGALHWIEDWERAVMQRPPVGSEAWHVGRELAATPGSVVLRNRLVELIEYTPTTATVHPEPVFIVPAWIMKYYILDLTERDSMVRWLLDQGHRVFVVSWKNPGPDDRDLGMDDYLRLGVREPLAWIRDRCAGARVHATGYCLGGTLLAIAAAALAREGDDSLATITLLAAQTDFKEAGELTLFINESQLAFLDDLMWQQGYLTGAQMAGSFRLLRSNDLIWSRSLRQYLMGEREPVNALGAWNADSTRMPYRMNSEYLHRLFLDNDLAEGRYVVEGAPVALADIRTPVFLVATEHDHVSPWRSVYKLHLTADAEITFVLASGGHNVGIVSPPGDAASAPRRSWRLRTHAADAPHLAPDRWLAETVPQPGSWWPAWHDWLAARSGHRQAAPSAPLALDAAPGQYVMQR